MKKYGTDSAQRISQKANGCLAFLIAILMLSITACTAFYDYNIPTLIIKPHNNEVSIDFQGASSSILKAEKSFYFVGDVSIHLKSGAVDTVYQLNLNLSETYNIDCQYGQFHISK